MNFYNQPSCICLTSVIGTGPEPVEPAGPIGLKFEPQSGLVGGLEPEKAGSVLHRLFFTETTGFVPNWPILYNVTKDIPNINL